MQPTILRCDDPTQPSGWQAVPLNFSTLTLDSAVIQAQTGGGIWHTVRTYQTGYGADSASYTCWTQGSSQNIACPGEHLLTSVSETPYQVMSGVVYGDAQPGAADVHLYGAGEERVL